MRATWGAVPVSRQGRASAVVSRLLARFCQHAPNSFFENSAPPSLSCTSTHVAPLFCRHDREPEQEVSRCGSGCHNQHIAPTRCFLALAYAHPDKSFSLSRSCNTNARFCLLAKTNKGQQRGPSARLRKHCQRVPLDTIHRRRKTQKPRARRHILCCYFAGNPIAPCCYFANEPTTSCC